MAQKESLRYDPLIAILDETPGGGRRLGRYQLLRPLGAGGMGAVYLGADEQLKRDVAVKILSPQLAKSAPSAIKRFLLEAQNAAQIVHPNVIGVFETGEIRGTHYIVMELARGASAAEILQYNGRLPVNAALEILRQAAEGLAAAHDAAIVHRDVKPENIIILPNGTVKVADLGLAKNLDSTDVELTEPGYVVGTPQYSSPEQISGNSPDHRTDIWSLGVTGFRLLTGQPLFKSNNLVEIVQNVLYRELPTCETVATGIPQPVADLIRWMMTRSLESRAPTMRAVLEQIEKIKDRSTPELNAPTMKFWREIVSSSMKARDKAAGIDINENDYPLTLMTGGLNDEKRKSSIRLSNEPAPYEDKTTKPLPRAVADAEITLAQPAMRDIRREKSEPAVMKLKPKKKTYRLAAGLVSVFLAAIMVLMAITFRTETIANDRPADRAVIQPSVAEPTVAEPTVAEPTVAEPTVAEPTVAEPTVAEPTVAEPTVAEPAVAEPAVAEPAVAEPTVAESTVAEPTVAEPTVAEPAVAEPAVAEPAVAEPAVAEPAVAEPAVAEPTVAESTVAEPAVAEPAVAEPAVVNDTGMVSIAGLTFIRITCGSFVPGFSLSETTPLPLCVEPFRQQLLDKAGIQPITAIQDFYISQTEISESLFRQMMDSSTSSIEALQLSQTDAHLPVRGIAFITAIEFSNKMDSLLLDTNPDMYTNGWRISIPTGLQWEYAARLSSDGTILSLFPSDAFSSETGLPKFTSAETIAGRLFDFTSFTIWLQTQRAIRELSDSTTKPSPVGVNAEFSNQQGIYGLYGNVREWCVGQDGAELRGGCYDRPAAMALPALSTRLPDGATPQNAGVRLVIIKRSDPR